MNPADLARHLNDLAQLLESRRRHHRSPLIVLELSAELRRRLEQLEALAVREARLEGATWQEIADKLGESRQAAHKKHATDVEGGNE